MQRKVRATMVAATTLWLLVGLGFAAQTTGGDEAIVRAVRDALEREGLEDTVVDIEVRDGVVVLMGQARNAYTKMKAIEVALGVSGVEAVESELTIAQAESNEALAQEIVNQVLRYSQYTVFDDITLHLEEGGVVTLGGYVTMPFKKDEIEKRVGTVLGVTELTSTIEVLPASQSDDQLRQALYRNIYGHDLFFPYARQTNPPIHIIVDGGKVILTGAVRNRVEQRQAESIARSTFGVVQVESRLTINP